jgi:3-methyladenine DNA glycosylase AlkD
MNMQDIMRELESYSDNKSLEHMARYGMDPSRGLGVRIPRLRDMGKRLGKNRDLAFELWAKGMRETMVLASLVDIPKQVTEEQMDAWVTDLYDWESCDQLIMNLFGRSPLAVKKALEWSRRDEEYVKRAGYVIMARLAVTEKKAPDSFFNPFFPLIEEGASDERNAVKKSVNWALRQIGKKNLALNKKALASARRIAKMKSKAAKWIASDAIRELESPQVQNRLKKLASKPE